MKIRLKHYRESEREDCKAYLMYYLQMTSTETTLCLVLLKSSRGCHQKFPEMCLNCS